MTTPTPPQPAEGTPYASPAVLGLSLRQLRDWEARASRRVVCPKPDHQAWEDTEIDVRRVVL
jgi:hypothetical protein